MDEVITKCKNWVDSEMCNIRWGTEDGFLHELLSIWLTATENGLDLFQISHEQDSCSLFISETSFGCFCMKPTFTVQLPTCRLSPGFLCLEGEKSIGELCVKSLAINFVGLYFHL